MAQSQRDLTAAPASAGAVVVFGPCVSDTVPPHDGVMRIENYDPGPTPGRWDQDDNSEYELEAETGAVEID